MVLFCEGLLQALYRQKKNLFAGLNDISVYIDSDEVQPTNPFLQPQKENTVLDIALQILATVTARKAPRKKNYLY